MITALRAALLCQKTTKTADDMISLEGLYTDRFTYAQKPAYVRASLFMHLDLDGRSAPASVRFKAPHFKHRVPMVTPLGMTNTSLVVDFVLPIVEPGELLVALLDEGPRGKSFTAKWALGFTPDAVTTDVNPDEVVRLCNEETEAMLAKLTGRAPERH